MSRTQCKVCQYGPELVDWTLSKTEIARIVGCHRESVSRHIKHSEDPELTVGASFEEREDGQWIPRRRWETPTGEVLNSFQFVPNAPENVEMLDYSTISAALSDFTYTPGFDLTGKPEVFVWADPQLGKAGERGGGTKETLERTFAARDRFIDRIRSNKPSVVYLVDAGDPIENCFSTGSQIGTNDLTVPDQILTYERVTVELIKSLLPYTSKVIHVTVTSNHGEARNGQKNNPYTSENDWGLHMQQVVKDRFAERPDLPVEFIRPDESEDTAVFTTEDGTRVAVTHGHHAGSPNNMRKWVEGQVVGQRPGWNADIWITAHFHHSFSKSFGKHKMILGAPSCDPGSAWVTRKTGEEATPGVLALTIADGSWLNYSIL